MTCSAWDITWPCETDAYDAGLVTLAQAAAQDLLFAVSGRRHGICTVTESYRAATSGGCAMPYKDSGGQWRNGVAGSECCRIRLNNRPVREVLSVIVEGSGLAPTDYTLGVGGVLRRIGGCWPTVADCDAAVITVEYRWGITPPPLASFAMGETACEFLSGFTTGTCRLPSNLVSLARQGVTQEFADAAESWKQKRLGLPFADAFVRSVNPNGLDEPSGVYSPDLPRRS